MTRLYLDTNIFLYAADRKSPYFRACTKFLKYSLDKDIPLLTSVETVQELIHYTKNTHQLSKGLKIAKNLIKVVAQLLPLTEKTIEIYLKMVKKHPESSSRDLIHLATCLENGLEKIITFDKDFKSFKGFTPLLPELLAWDPV